MIHRPIGRRLLIAIVIGAVTALTGCSAMHAQNPSSALQPVNAGLRSNSLSASGRIEIDDSDSSSV